MLAYMFSWLFTQHIILCLIVGGGLNYKFWENNPQVHLKVTSAIKQQLLEMCHLKHGLRIFLFHRKTVFRSEHIQVIAFLTTPWFTKFVMPQWVLVHETRCIFEYIFWTTNHEVTKLGQLINISKYNNFQ